MTYYLDGICCTNRLEVGLRLTSDGFRLRDSTRHAQICEDVKDRGTDLDLGNLTVDVARREVLTR
jgi:hypothetical protein